MENTGLDQWESVGAAAALGLSGLYTLARNQLNVCIFLDEN